MMRAKVRIGRVEKIFVSHLHGDHCYGLPGVVCAASAARDQVATSMDTALKLYGPPGLSEFIRISLEIGQVRVRLLRFHSTFNYICAFNLFFCQARARLPLPLLFPGCIENGCNSA